LKSPCRCQKLFGIATALQVLKALPSKSPQRMLRICFVTHQLSGLTQNGGMGVAITSLSQHLAKAGHRITILSLKRRHSQTKTFGYWQKHYAEQSIELIPLPDSGDYIHS
jgi:hypothetical protein